MFIPWKDAYGNTSGVLIAVFLFACSMVGMITGTIIAKASGATTGVIVFFIPHTVFGCYCLVVGYILSTAEKREVAREEKTDKEIGEKMDKASSMIQKELAEARVMEGKVRNAADLIQRYRWRTNRYKLQVIKHLQLMKKAKDMELQNQEDLQYRKIKGSVFQDYATSQGLDTELIERDIWQELDHDSMIEIDFGEKWPDWEGSEEYTEKFLKTAYHCRGLPFAEKVIKFYRYPGRHLAVRVARLHYEIKEVTSPV